MSLFDGTDSLPDDEHAVATPFTMRAPCKSFRPQARDNCQNTSAWLKSSNGQRTAYCRQCGAFCYCVPKHELGEVSLPTLSEKTRRDLDSWTKARIRERDGFRCLMCGLGGDAVILHVGHFLSVKDGIAAGLTPDEINDDSNLLTLCEECNLALREHSLPPRLLPTLIRVWRSNGRQDARAARGGTEVRGSRLARLPSSQSD